MASLKQLLAKRKEQIDEQTGEKPKKQTQEEKTRKAILRAKNANKKKKSPKSGGGSLVTRFLTGK
jgi:hypothetical protein